MKEHDLNVICINKNNNLVVFYTKNKKKNLVNKLYEITKLNISKVKFVKIGKIPVTINKKTNYNKLIDLC